MRARALTVILLAGALALGAVAPAMAAPRAEQNEIEAEVMCPVCGTLLELAESPQAQRQKVFIARLISAGRSKQEIKDALVAEYGDEVLALPRGSGFSLSAYLVPIVAFIVAVAALAIGVRRWRRDGDGGDSPRPSPQGPSAAESERLDADLSRYDL